MHTQLGESVAQILRIDCARGKRPRLVLRSRSVRIQIGNGDAVDRLGGMSGKPSEDVGLEAALGENVPQRFDLARSAGDRADAAVLRVRFHKSVDAVFVGALARGN